MEFVNKPRAQESSVGPAPSFQEQALHAEFAIEDVQRTGEVELRVAADVRTAPADLAVGVQHHAVRLHIALREPRLAGKALPRRGRVGLAFGELLTRDAANQPGVTGKFVVHALEEIPGRSLRPPASGKRPTVDAGCREADDMRFHAKLLIPPFRWCSVGYLLLQITYPRLARQRVAQRQPTSTDSCSASIWFLRA